MADLDHIADYSEQIWGAARAQDYVSRLVSALERLQAYPDSGSPVEHAASGYRKLSAGRHSIYYRPTEKMIEIVRILHQAMDINQAL